MKKLLFALFLGALVFPALAQQDDAEQLEAFRALTPPELVPGGPNGQGSGVVGALPAQVDVSALGGAVYSIPFKVPEGINGMQPDLSVVYNSQSGNGLLGWGWNIGGLSAITRVSSTFYHDSIVDGVDFDGYDRFALDGQRLIVLGNSTYGSNNAEYKTEVDGMSKIVSYTTGGIIHGPAWFKVWTPEGLVLEYGSTANSRLEFTLGSNKEVGMWLLRTVTDRNGNYMSYEYNNDGESVTIKKIYYTGTTDLYACYSVVFDYDDAREDVELSFVGNHVVKQKQLLEHIRVKCWDQEMWRYDFAYESGTGAGTLDYYKRLSSITFTCGAVRYNPTQIIWGERPAVTHASGTPPYGIPGFNDYTTRIQLNGSPNGVSALTGVLKFPGDFNGDGLTDFVSVQYNSGLIYSLAVDDLEESRYVYSTIVVYQNKGNTKTDSEDGIIRFDTVPMLSLKSNETNSIKPIEYAGAISITGLKWVYTCDFNGDGLDDFILHRRLGRMITINAFKSVLDGSGNLSFERVLFNNSYDFLCGNPNDSEEHVLVGDFMGSGQQDIIVAPSLRSNNNADNFYYLSYTSILGGKFICHEANCGMQGTSFVTGDFNGDGKTEIWYALNASGNNGKIVQIYNNSNSQFHYSWSAIKENFLNTDHVIFTGDFNGDGKTDFLSYNKSSYAWIVRLFKSDDCYSTTFDVGASLALCYADPGSYQQSIEDQIYNVNYFFQVTDVNGDGKSDVIFVRDNSLYIAFSPLYNDSQYGGQFSFVQNNISLTQAGLGNAYSYTFGVGDFLGEGASAVFVDYWLYSKTPLSTYYSVASITDGMGNSSDFEYGYLVNNPMNNDNIFSLSSVGQNHGLSIYSKPLPVQAVKEMVSRNLYSEAPARCQRYGYKNALIHQNGRGFLGFEENTTSTRLADSLQSQTIRHYSISDMASHPFAVLKWERSYAPSGYLLSEGNYSYLEYQCDRSHRGRVFFPALNNKTMDSYDVASGAFFGRTIEETTYSSSAKDAGALDYSYAVSSESSSVGTHSTATVTTASSCEFQTNTSIVYQTPNYNDWVIQRPLSVRTTQKRLGNYTTKESLTVYQYGLTNPFLVSNKIYYPGGDENNANGLATKVSYEYDAVGNVTKKTLRDLENSLEARMTEYEYQRFQSPSLERNALGYETQTEYNSYWELIRTTDCNGLVTHYWNDDHLGSTSYLKRPEGTYGCLAKRWAFDVAGDPVTHAPDHAAYYTWERSTGEAPIIVFYDASDRELRTVTEDIEGRAIYRDTEYDSLGRIEKQWEPYYWDQQRQYHARYTYDLAHRPDTIFYPDGTLEKTVYSSAQGISEVTKVFHASNGDSRITTQIANIMGWTTESTDNSGATVYYSYYADGKLRKAGLNPDMEVVMQYDDAGNRTVIVDPDYGQRTSVYNAFGELLSSTSPKGDVTEYRWDVLGRMVKRYDCDNSANSVDSTIWVYGSADGEKGLLKRILFDNVKQVKDYTYDTLCRPVIVSESRMNGRPYQTQYMYYGGTGKVSQITYPTGFVVKREYLNGRLWRIKDSRNQILWQTLKENANGQIVSYMTGNQVVDTLSYFDDTHMLQRQYAKKGAATIQDFRYTYDDFCNLASRSEWKYATPMTETFKYDHLDRLDSVLFNNAVSEMVYDAYGRMRSRSSEGDMVFRQASYYDQSKPHAVRWAEVNGDVFSGVPQTITYTMHDKVKTIQQGDDELTIDYGYDRQRIEMTQENDEFQTMSSKLYVGNCEFNHGELRLQRLTYLSGPMGVFAVYEELGPLYKGGGQEGSDDEGEEGDDPTDSGFAGALYYLHRDHLGSVTTITDESGTVVQELSYDAWGNLRNPTTWSGTFTGTPKFDRGYTGHEHLCTFGLINMNGRVYDPVMCCFLSVDTYVQDPGSPQNFNRYAYCLNNPLKYTDPDGEWVQYVIGGLLGAWNGYSIGKAAGLNGWDLFFSTIGGAAVGALSGGIGTYMSSISTAAVGGLCGGVVSGAGNGLIQGLANKSDKLGLDVWNGLWKGGLSGLVGGYVGGGAGMYGGKGAFWGGIASSLTNEVCNYATVDNYKVNWLNVGLGGVMSYGVYHAQVLSGYLFGGFNNKLSYSEFCDMMSLSQQSMREWREGKFIAYYDEKKPFLTIGTRNNVSTTGQHENACFDYHTHPEWPSQLSDYDLMSTSRSAIQAGLQPNECDEAARVVLTKIGCEHMYQSSRNGSIVYMTNEIINMPNILNHFAQYRVSYNYFSLFHYYQHHLLLDLKLH